MKAIVYHDTEDLRHEDVPTPTVGDGEALIKVEACAVCGTDLRTFHHGNKAVTPGRILGHEFCGTMVESADPDLRPAVGQRAVMYIVLNCGSCRYCQAGRANLCERRTTMSYHHDGAFAEYIKIPASAVRAGNLYPVPDAVPTEHAALSEPLGCVLNAHSRLGIGFTDRVVVIGGGPIGIMHALAARARGAQQVILLEVSQQRLTMAQRFGFDAYVRSDPENGHHDEIARLTEGFGPSVVIVACSVAAAQVDALEIAGKGARVEFFGGLPKSNPIAPLDTNHLHYKELVVTGSYSEKRSDFEAARALINAGRFPAGDIITHQLPLARTTEAFDLMKSGEALKVLIRPQEVSS